MGGRRSASFLENHTAQRDEGVNGGENEETGRNCASFSNTKALCLYKKYWPDVFLLH